MVRPAAALAVAALLVLAGCGAQPARPPTADDGRYVVTSDAAELDRELAAHAQTFVHTRDDRLVVDWYPPTGTVSLPDQGAALWNATPAEQTLGFLVVALIGEYQTGALDTPVTIRALEIADTGYQPTVAWTIRPEWVAGYERGTLTTSELLEQIRDTRTRLTNTSQTVG